MLVVASDRVSVFDVVLPDLIPDKGRVLTALSTFWFEQTAAPRARTTWCRPTPPTSPRPPGPTSPAGRCSCGAAQPVRLECIARGYLFGSAWSEYQEHGHGAGPHAAGRAARRPSGCPSRSSRPPPRPTTATTSRCPTPRPPTLVGADRLRAAARPSRSRSTSSAPRTRPTRGLILADTKFEFGERRRRAAA